MIRYILETVKGTLVANPGLLFVALLMAVAVIVVLYKMVTKQSDSNVRLSTAIGSLEKTMAEIPGTLRVEMRDGINALRSAISKDIGELHRKVDAGDQRLREKVSENSKGLHDRIDLVERQASKDVAELKSRLTAQEKVCSECEKRCPQRNSGVCPIPRKAS